VFLLQDDVIAFTLMILPSDWRFAHQYWRFFSPELAPHSSKLTL
jgi:hypothetical protein